ncbi:MAG TPA: DUF222 domain-containing protein [Cellulomonas sp.]
MAAIGEDVDLLVAVLDELDGWTALGALLAVEKLVGRLSGVGARLLARVEGDGLWATRGGRSVTDWLAVSAGLPYARARERVQLSRALRDHLPATAEAVLTGEVPVAQAQALAKYAVTTQARQQAMSAPADQCGEKFLLAHAKEQTADGYRRLVQRWSAATDPEADERGYRGASDREFVALSPTTGGVHLAGFLTTEHGAVVATMLESVTGPPAAGDERTAQQRRATALVDAARLVLDQGLTGTGAAVRPHITVAVDFDTFRRVLEGPARDEPAASFGTRDRAGALFGTGTAPGASFVPPGPRTSGSGCLFRLAPVADVERFAVGEIVGTGPIPSSVLARLACDSEISRVVFGPDSQVINVGRAERTFSGPRRRAIIARDQTCRYPGCHAPPALGELHHLQWWARDGGETDVNAGILLCWYHHDLVHTLRIEIRRSPTGGWQFLTRHGDVVTV